MSQYQGIKQKDTGGVQIDASLEPVEITGGVQIGNTIVELEGMQRFNSVSKKMEYWDGVAWIEMAAGGGGVDLFVAFSVVNTPRPEHYSEDDFILLDITPPSAPSTANTPRPTYYSAFAAQDAIMPVVLENP